MSLGDIRIERIEKGKRFKDPYPATARRTNSITELLGNFAKLSHAKKNVVVAGRVIAMREHGGSSFLDLRDESGKIQAFLKKDGLGDESYQFFIDTVDIGDFLEFSGKFFETKRGEKTVEVSDWRMLAKSLRPLPEKWHGLQDIEERFRRRYLDLLMNEEVRERFFLRSKIIKSIREFFEREDFLEVETPILQPVPGGALARPFKTHHNALDVDLFLRIAPELYLKRLLVGGYGRVFEVARNFRNEGIDATHNPEFTMLEAYAAWWDENDMMAFVENLFLALAKKIFGKKEFEYDGKKILCKAPFPRITFAEVLKKYGDIGDYKNITREDLRFKAQQAGIMVYEGEPKGKIADEIFKKVCRQRLIDPVFVTNHPVDISPLAKKNEEDSEYVRRFQFIAAGLEVMNGFSELNDPVDQAARFLEQKKDFSDESHKKDDDFVEAVEYGMPPAAGVGIGIDRLVMLLTDTRNIKEVILFPTLKPR